MLVVICMVMLLVAMLLPSLAQARRQACIASCSMNPRALLTGLAQYTSEFQDLLPPIGLAGAPGDIPLSGHWGGFSQNFDPARNGFAGLQNVNLYVLLAGAYVTPGHLLCTGADGSFRSGSAGFFPFTERFSTYCLRLPYSLDLFSTAPNLVYPRAHLMAAFCGGSSGQPDPGGSRRGAGGGQLTLPYVRLSRQYLEVHPLTSESRYLSYGQSPILSDNFWLERFQSPRLAPPESGGKAFAVRASWCHGDRFNVGFGDGSVRTVRDAGKVSNDTDKVVWSNSVHGVPPGDDQNANASYALNVWRFFEDSVRQGR